MPEVPKRNTSRRQPAYRVSVSAPVALVLLFLLLVLVASMALDVPSNLWSQPGLSELRSEVMAALGLPTPPGPSTAAPLPTPSSPAGGLQAPSVGTWYQVYFTDPKYPDKPNERGEGIDRHLVALINQARHTVDVAAYELDLETVAQALLQAKQRGVAVRLVTDTDNLEEKVIQQLKQSGIPVVDDKRGAIMHNKFIVIDRRYVWTGSWNLTVNCTYRNNNNAIWIDSEALARTYSDKFSQMFDNRRFGPSRPPTAQTQLTIAGTRIENYFSAEDRISERLAPLLRSAQKSIRFLAFSFTDDTLGQILIERAKAGVSVSGVMEQRGADTEHSEYATLRKAGIDVLLDGNPYVMHHKIFVIDESIVVLGSYNFSANADKDNDENILFIYNRDIARQYLDEFERVRKRAAEAKS